MITVPQAHASKLAKDAEAPDNRFKGFDEFMASAKARAAAKTQAQAPADTETAKTEAEDQPYSPSAGVMVEDDPDLPDLVSLIGSSGVTGQKEVIATSLVATSSSAPAFVAFSAVLCTWAPLQRSANALSLHMSCLYSPLLPPPLGLSSPLQPLPLLRQSSSESLDTVQIVECHTRIGISRCGGASCMCPVCSEHMWSLIQ